MINQNWKGRNVLITGGDGFIASHLVKRLQQLSANVIITTRHKKAKDNLDVLNSIFESHPITEYTDLFSLEETFRIFDIHEIDTVFHLAASSLVASSANAPHWTLKNNILTTMNILEASRVRGIERTIIASSDKAYGDHNGENNVNKLPYKEDFDLRGIDIYSVSKMCSDTIAQSYAFQFNIPIAITRSCNIYGPGDFNFSRIIPRTIIRLLNHLPPEITLGNENVLREYCYIDDVINAYLLLANSMNSPQTTNGVKRTPSLGYGAYNIGNYATVDPDRISEYANVKNAKGLINLLEDLCEIQIDPIINQPGKQIFEIGNQYNDCSKLFDLGYKPQYTMEDGLNRTIAWYRQNKLVCDKLAVKYLNKEKQNA